MNQENQETDSDYEPSTQLDDDALDNMDVTAQPINTGKNTECVGAQQTRWKTLREAEIFVALYALEYPFWFVLQYSLDCFENTC